MMKTLHLAGIKHSDRTVSTGSAKKLVLDLLSSSGIVVGGSLPSDITVHNDEFYARILRDGSLGLGESYMDGWWDCECLDDFFCRLIPSEPEKRIRTSWKLLYHAFKSRVINRGSRSRAFEVGERHYDLGNELYERMLDRRMVYSCAYWKDADNLDAAQEAKLDLVCRKLGLRAGGRVLDIGCGWGGFARYAAEQYGASVVGLTVSREQAHLARERCAGLPVEIRLQDYRDTEGEFDNIVSLGMFEHVGYKNYGTYMKTARRLLKDNGLFLLHTIGRRETRKENDPWLEKYIFPNSMIPSMKQISGAAENRFVVEDWHNFGADYDATLLAWFANFAAHWDALKERYDERFFRMWKYYLLSCAAAFRSRHMQVWQIVLSKKGVAGGYPSVR